MPSRLRLCPTVLFAVATAALACSAEAQDWRWPEKGKNFQVFPKDFPAQKLSAVMKGFTRSLGVRCTYCHVGQEGKPLSTYDFASDENPNKKRAREMYLMLGEINDHLKKIESSGDKRVNMWCHTCHQGRPRPATLEEELGAAYRKSGVSAAIARYRDLRERYYGKGGYNFGEASLNAFGYELFELKDVDGALAIWHVNATQFPQSGNVWDSLGEGYRAAGKKTLAEIYYRKALELDPQNENALEKLRGLAEKPAP